MGHGKTNLDNIGVYRQQAWHGLANVIEDQLGAVEFGEKINLFYPVTGLPLFYLGSDGQYHQVESHVANVRTRDAENQPCEHLLGVVGSGYQICQNRELAEFTDALAQTGKVVIESCGSIDGGRRLWFLAKGESFNVGGLDRVVPYICVTNSHDGTSSIRVTPTTVRVVCKNTFNMVVPNELDLAVRPETAAIVLRHSGKLDEKLERAKEAIKHYGQVLKRNQELFEALQAKKFSQEQALKLFADVYAANWEVATPEELASPDAKERKIAENRFERMRKASEAFQGRYRAESQALGLGNTAWAYFNALTGYIQHDKVARGQDDVQRTANRIESNLFGLNANRTHDALAATLAIAG